MGVTYADDKKNIKDFLTSEIQKTDIRKIYGNKRYCHSIYRYENYSLSPITDGLINTTYLLEDKDRRKKVYPAKDQ
jgi:hypothetical protein